MRLIMKKIVIKPNEYKDVGLCLTSRVVGELKKYCAEIYIEEQYALRLGEGVIGYAPDAFPQDCDLIVVLGGDGSMLHAAADALTYNVPLLGINMGRVGYLASLEPDELDALSKLFDGSYMLNEHITLSVSVRRKNGEEIFLGNVLNDVVVGGTGHLSDMRLYHGEHHLDYRADGLIVATPTGSTAYSLSAGGPVMEEGMDLICVTPVCPRSFFSRSLLFSPGTALRIVNTTTRGGDLDVSLDGILHHPLAFEEEVLVRRSERSVKILTLSPRNLLKILRTKMDMQHF